MNENASKLAYTALEKNITSIENMFANNDEMSSMARVFRNTSVVRRNISSTDLIKAVEFYIPNCKTTRQTLLTALAAVVSEAMEVEKSPSSEAIPESRVNSIPEVEFYLSWLTLIMLLEKKLYQDASTCVSSIIEYAASFNRRSADALIAKIFTCFSRIFELSGDYASIRKVLLNAHRTACLRHNEIGQATLLNLILRNLIHFKLYDQASKLIFKVTFPTTASNNQYVRYLNYLGKIQAVQLEYSDSYANLSRSLRKAPQNTALGFRVSATKLIIIVQLLMGEVPERSLFATKEMVKALEPYLQLTQAVRIGDLDAFSATETELHDTFLKDDTANLIQRLRQNVIKTALRRINISYSRISFNDIAAKLKMDSSEDAEFACAKAIRDGVLDASLNHDEGYMECNVVVNVYNTQEPQQAFHKRIKFCLDVRNEAVKAMRYPDETVKKVTEEPKEEISEADIIAAFDDMEEDE